MSTCMMSNLLRTCRRLLRELNRAEPEAWKGHVWKYIASEVRSPPSPYSEADHQPHTPNLQLLENYLTYVQSSREHRELLARYQGRGERSVEESAHLVGLELPNQSTA